VNNDDKLNLSGALAAATCTLLGSNLPEAVQAQEEPGWDFDTALLYYGEDQDRIQDLSFATLATRTYLDDRFLSLGFTIDGLTGASPNGALPMGFPQTFTQPSGKKTYTIDADTLPIDDTFRDIRAAFTINWQQPMGRMSNVNFGASASKEYDYMHLGVNARISRDFNQRNTTLSAGFAYASDTIDPVGGTPLALTPMINARDDEDDGGLGRSTSESKDVFDIVLGVTQVISRNLVVQANYSYSDSSGYLNDPYKILSVVDGVTGDAVPVPQIPGIDGPSHLYLYEQRPEDRAKHSLYTQAKYYMRGKVLDVSYRYMTDDWEIDSHTIDLRYRWPVSDRSYLEPHLRFYSQSAAEFYTLNLVEDEPLPENVSADYRLGDFDGITAGLKYGWKTGGGNDVSVRLEWYQQSSNVSSNQLIGSQAVQDNVPDLNAVILQFGYSFGL